MINNHVSLKKRLLALALWPLVFVMMVVMTLILVFVSIVYPALALAGMVEPGKRKGAKP